MKFDIVTPSYNHGPYLRETIESVLSQEDSDVELSYCVLDGGSTDGSPELIRSYESRLAFWRSAPDGGQTAAIAEGLSLGNGDVVAWVNSDDFYPSGAFRRVTEFFNAHPEVDALYGDCLMVDERSNPVGLGTHIPVSWEDLFETPYLINQESTFVRRRIYEQVGGVDPSYWGAMDYDLWLRTFREGRAAYLPEVLGVHRFLPEQKSSSSDRYVGEMKRAREKFARLYSLPVPPWPFSVKGWDRMKAKWETKWAPILKWVDEGCKETEWKDAVLQHWRRYAQKGILAVRGTTSFGWAGPDSLYILDRQEIGPAIEWALTSPVPTLSARSIALKLGQRNWDIELESPVSLTLPLNGEGRFSVLRIIADRAFVPALENFGPAYLNLSIGSYPKPQGKQVVSVQSIPCLPEIRCFEEPKKVETVEPVPLRRSRRKRQLRVAFLTSHPAGVASGSERLMYETVKALIARGYDARVYTMNARMEKDPPFFAYPIPHFPLERKIERLFRRLTGLNDLLFPSTALLRVYPWIGAADLWHFHNLHGHYLSLPLLSVLSWTKPMVITPVDQFLLTGHCPYPLDCERYKGGCGMCPRLDERHPGISKDVTSALWWIKRLFHRYSRVNMFFHTDALAGEYKKVFVNDPSYKVIHYGVDTDCFRPVSRNECAYRLGLNPSSRFVVGLFHSYISDPRKGILSIIEKLGVLAKEKPGHFELLVVGHNSTEVLNRVPPELPVRALPFLKHSHELADALNLCDVLLYPTQSENLSLTCLSALACGVPVISYDVGGQGEAVVHGTNGFLVPLNDSDGMSEALRNLIQDSSLQQRLSEGARRLTKERFDFDRYIDQLVEYYYEILSNRKENR
jgi:glycosyltransferase involved in cell wall biosynthesis